MSGSGLIYAAIALMWAAVLIPMWLKNHDTATENRSAERFGQAMRVLSRKEGRDEATGDVDGAQASERQTSFRAEDVPRQPAERPAQPPAGRPVERPTQRRQASKPRQRRAPRPPLTLMQRRARSLGVLAGLTLVMVVLSALTPLPWWSAVPFAGLLVAFVVHLRVQARQRVHRRVAPQGQASRTSTAPEAAAPSTASAESPQSRKATSVVQGPSRAVVVETKGQASAAKADAPATDGAEATDDEWRPNPLPLPTYVTAPKAVRPIKVIDLTTPGAWTSGRLFDDEVAEEDFLAAQVVEDELDALLDQEVAPTVDPDGQKRRAVGD